MGSKITNDILEASVVCPYKAYLKYAGHSGSISEYEAVLQTLRSKVKEKVTQRILWQNPERAVVTGQPLTTATLKCGSLFVLDARIEDDRFTLTLDGLKRVPGSSPLGAFLYLPIVFHEAQLVRKEQRLVLALYSVVLTQHQGTVSTSGIIWHGRDGQATRVQLTQEIPKAEQILGNLKKGISLEQPPPLILNDHCQICEFRQRCYEQAVQEDTLSLLRGMSGKEVKGYNRKGIFTVTQLAHTFRPRRKSKRAKQETSQRSSALQALAIRDKRIYVIGKPTLPQKPVQMYFDIESNPDAGFVYLIGLIVVENGTEHHSTFWADRKEQESTIFEQFIAEVCRHEDFVVFCYGNYDRAFLKRMRQKAKRKKFVDRILAALVNVLTVIYPHVYFPTYSNSLKDIGRYLEFTWTADNASGVQSIVWRLRWETTGSEEWKQKLTRYNLDDCLALKKVTELLWRIVARVSVEAQVRAEEKDTLPIARVEEIEKLTDYYTWGKVKFVHSDYEYINNCAYFNYQRERVYIRTSEHLRKKSAKKKKFTRRKLKASLQLTIVASQCPTCKSRKVSRDVHKQIRSPKPRVKTAYDLEFTPTGIRRKVMECRTSVHQCLSCGAEFIPHQHPRLDKHFHGLKSWAMFQHVAYRLSLSTIQKMCDEFFGIRLIFGEVLMFKLLMARYYKGTYQKLLLKILSGPLLHVDETEVKLQTGKGYVWVFTNLEEVVYMYRPTREGEFLRELLKSFQGILISDFYSAYDALPCPQQKCLIHLIRDMNQELLNNPFDEELKEITRSFGSLLRTIITTVDEHGLRRKYLKHHEAAVETYFGGLSAQRLHSEAAEALRARMIKYQDKLFTFLKYDGVPWNNNNAEHAIKQFAYYREQTTGALRETGLSDYLVLLSICQTCRYKDVSFLQFLLSKEKDVEVFYQKKRRQPRRGSIELYPKGFVPPHLAYNHRKRSPSVQERALPRE
jgi:predicted RecB family nuclease